jgi:secondary thiamine-phosphate synthase enzyme
MSTLVGASETLLVNGGRLALGSWQGIYLAEFDGPRQRRVLVKIVPDRA